MFSGRPIRLLLLGLSGCSHGKSPATSQSPGFGFTPDFTGRLSKKSLNKMSSRSHLRWLHCTPKTIVIEISVIRPVSRCTIMVLVILQHQNSRKFEL